MVSNDQYNIWFFHCFHSESLPFSNKKTYPTNSSRSNRVFPRLFSNKTPAFWFSQLLKKTTINDPKNIKKRVYHIILYIYVLTTFRNSHCPPTSQRGGRDSQRIHSSNNSMDSITNASESSEGGRQVGGSHCFLGTGVNGRFFIAAVFGEVFWVAWTVGLFVYVLVKQKWSVPKVWVNLDGFFHGKSRYGRSGNSTDYTDALLIRKNLFA